MYLVLRLQIEMELIMLLLLLLGGRRHDVVHHYMQL